MGNKALVDKLIQGFQQKDPRLYDVLRLISGELAFLDQSIVSQINALVTAKTETTTSPDLLPPVNFSFDLPGRYLTLSWDTATSASVYEIRKGSTWETASLVTRTSSLSTQLNPIAAGSHTYLIKSINSSGVYSSACTTLNLTISTVREVFITFTVIDNNVLLYWNAPNFSSFDVDYYEIFREGVSLGTKPGTFTTIFETTGGTYTYGVVAYDLAGNASGMSTVDIEVKAPPDFDLIARGISTFTGTKTNCIIDGTRLLAPVESKTFQQHFVDHSWTKIQDQISAGYPLYIQPANSSATYEEKFDFGTIFDNIIITAKWTKELVVADDVVVTSEIKYSTDDATYTTYAAGPSLFASSLRYVKVKLTFTPATLKALVYISDFQCLLDVKYGTDSGDVEALSTDAGGTAVLFNKDFRDVNSITVSCLDTTPIYVVYDFTDVPDPTGFFVYAFNSAGVRVTKTVSWKARGII